MNEIVTQIYIHCADFREIGVTKTQMEEVLEDIENEMGEMDISGSQSSVEPQLSGRIKETIILAEEAIFRTFLQEVERGR